MSGNGIKNIRNLVVERRYTSFKDAIVVGLIVFFIYTIFIGSMVVGLSEGVLANYYIVSIIFGIFSVAITPIYLLFFIKPLFDSRKMYFINDEIRYMVVKLRSGTIWFYSGDRAAVYIKCKTYLHQYNKEHNKENIEIMVDTWLDSLSLEERKNYYIINYSDEDCNKNANGITTSKLAAAMRSNSFNRNLFSDYYFKLDQQFNPLYCEAHMAMTPNLYEKYYKLRKDKDVERIGDTGCSGFDNKVYYRYTVKECNKKNLKIELPKEFVEVLREEKLIATNDKYIK